MKYEIRNMNNAKNADETYCQVPSVGWFKVEVPLL
jgi:hypothetical protein